MIVKYQKFIDGVFLGDELALFLMVKGQGLTMSLFGGSDVIYQVILHPTHESHVYKWEYPDLDEPMLAVFSKDEAELTLQSARGES